LHISLAVLVCYQCFTCVFSLGRVIPPVQPALLSGPTRSLGQDPGAAGWPPQPDRFGGKLSRASHPVSGRISTDLKSHYRSQRSDPYSPKAFTPQRPNVLQKKGLQGRANAGSLAATKAISVDFLSSPYLYA